MWGAATDQNGTNVDHREVVGTIVGHTTATLADIRMFMTALAALGCGNG
ncbi:hypothetical protein G5C51_12915 [Streptomyces sp. A7024]|uniref:Uncharacterized protein n=1 Tax=Streptomyces coryli TaxID=1128680 RepID=A0A6G4U0J0_9ACTN|nr:hypothetical protein [Streptomyces coryli]NGN64797.1 hypothetical protein [Streptomyces coryli]